MVLGFSYKGKDPYKTKSETSTSTNPKSSDTTLFAPKVQKQTKKPKIDKLKVTAKKQPAEKNLSQKMKSISLTRNKLPSELGLILKSTPKVNVIRSLTPAKVETKYEVVDLSSSPETKKPHTETVLNPFHVVPKKRDSKKSKAKSVENQTVDANIDSNGFKVFKSVQPPPKIVPGSLRPVVVDGMNVLLCVKNEYAKGTKATDDGKTKLDFSRIVYVMQELQKLGIKADDVTIVVQEYVKNLTKNNKRMVNYEAFQELRPYFKWPDRRSNGKNGKQIVCDDDRVILQIAQKIGAVIVTNDHYRDHSELAHREQNYERLKQIENRLLTFDFIQYRGATMCKFPEDPMGKKSNITLKQHIRF